MESNKNFKFCPKCGHQCNTEHLFCNKCGNALEEVTTCPNCHAEFQSADKFCQHCGKKLPDIMQYDSSTNKISKLKIFLWIFCLTLFGTVFSWLVMLILALCGISFSSFDKPNMLGADMVSQSSMFWSEFWAKLKLICEFVIITWIYYCPSLIAEKRKVVSLTKIIILNILLGWTGICWVISMVWAFKGERK